MPSPVEEIFSLRLPHGQLAAVLHRASPERLVILCHGFTGNKAESGRLFVTTARALQRAGLSALRFDFRGSGDSSGEFPEVTPNTQISDTLAVLRWARRKGFQQIGLLGLSFGGATAICAAQQAAHKPQALLTWSSVPSFTFWRTRPGVAESPQRGNPLRPGRDFYRDRPVVDVPAAYLSLRLPRLQIQGDCDLPGFRERFTAIIARDTTGARQVVIKGADHTFSQWPHRRRVIKLSVSWFATHLAPGRT